jgi:hypothetical protein
MLLYTTKNASLMESQILTADFQKNKTLLLSSRSLALFSDGHKMIGEQQVQANDDYF